MRTAILRAAMAAALLLLPTLSTASAAPTLRLCTGAEKGNYHTSGLIVRDQAKGMLAVELAPTAGSIDNLRRIEDGACDAAIVQADAYGVYKDRNPGTALMLNRVTTLYKEYAHLVCNAALGVGDVGDLGSHPEKFRVATGEAGSGTDVTWAAWVKLDTSYGKVPTLRIGGNQAILKTMDGAETSCFLWIGGLNSPFMKQINDQSAGKLRLVAVDDGDFDNAKDPQGNKIYTFTKIPGGIYKNLQSGFFSSAVTTLSVDAVFVISSAWVDANPRGFDDATEAVLRALPAIRQRVGQ